MLPPTRLRTGFVAVDDDDDDDVTDTVFALMRLFMKDAIVVAGRYTLAHERREVTEGDMKNALKYCARTFFERDDADLQTIVREEMTRMQEEDEEEEEEDEDEEDDEDEEEEDEEEEDDEEEEEETSVADESDRQLAKHVDAIVTTWHLWEPTDPVHQLVRRAIDHTPTTE